MSFFKPRSIYESWEVTKDKPSPFEPINFKLAVIQENFFPCSAAQEYVDFINDNHIEAFYEYDEYYRMPGYYSSAAIVDGVVWVTFVPVKIGSHWCYIPKPSIQDPLQEIWWELC